MTVVLLIMTVFLTGLLGIHPMISVVLLAEVVIRIGVDGLSPLAPGLALAGGWSSIICMRLAITAVVVPIITDRLVADKNVSFMSSRSPNQLDLWQI